MMIDPLYGFGHTEDFSFGSPTSVLGEMDMRKAHGG